MTFKNHRNSVH